MVEVFWTDEAKKWLKEIFYFIKEDNPKAAEKVVDSIVKKVELLKDFPEIGQKLIDWPNENIRMILHGHYRIVYLIVDEKRIDLLGVYHGALDLIKHLKIK